MALNHRCLQGQIAIVCGRGTWAVHNKTEEMVRVAVSAVCVLLGSTPEELRLSG